MATKYDDVAAAFSVENDNRPANVYYERPATLRLLPPLQGISVLDAGCGSGWYLEHCRNRGAIVTGYDPSAEMIAHARQRLGNCELHVCDSKGAVEILGQFDLILSNLVLHYVGAIRLEFRNYAALLKPGGSIVLSMRHPCYVRTNYLQTWTVSRTWEHGEMRTFQRPLSAITDAILAAGLSIARIVEAEPLPELEQASPQLWEAAKQFPLFIHMVLSKSSA